METGSDGSEARQEGEGMNQITAQPVDYVASARRHFEDARLLLEKGRQANAGQLFGFGMECGLKALLIACGVVPDETGSIPPKGKFRQHIPLLSDRIDIFGNLIPNGPMAQIYLAKIPGRSQFHNWTVDHRYYREAAMPLASLPAWENAAKEMSDMLDQAKTDGVI
jgi:hypothetical protein